MFLFILALLFGAGAVIAFFAARAFKTSEKYNAQSLRTGWLIGAGACAAVGAVCFLFSILTVVSTKQVGVVTAFGAPQGTLSNGLHVKMPWEKVTEFDAAIQTDSGSTDVRIGNQSTAGVERSIRWRIVPEAADDLYRDYKDFDNVRDSLVTRQLNAALNEVFDDYDPLSTLDTQGEIDQHDALTDLSAEVEAVLRSKIDSQIEVLSVIVPIVRFDDATEEKIRDYQSAIAETRIAEQRTQTAEQEARANRILSDSVSNDPNVLVSKCIDTLNNLQKTNQPIPAGFSCWPGGGSAVVVPSAK